MSDRRDKELQALCVLEPGEGTESILAYLQSRNVQCRLSDKIPASGTGSCDQEWDLILIDADIEHGDIMGFFEYCRTIHNASPLVALHRGGRGSRDAALIRMGAYDAFPRNIDRWNTEVYLDRAISQAHQAKALLSMSRTDHVTGLYNQRFMYENLGREIRRSSRTGKDLTVALLDLDNFKAYNDTYGHLMGDKALGEIANILLNSIRKGVDSAYRYGGDEFTLILPETDLPQAVKTLDRVLTKLARQTPGELTFSVGLALMSSCENVEQVLRTADEAMYEAKEAGGNGVVTKVCGEKQN
ncbi:MAG: GGDEF domain-containing protein [bacterium]|nr:GGDEF domain-containing protein [bacterium]MDT8395228.1 GGDEF domain-containing protein [bacterium]